MTAKLVVVPSGPAPGVDEDLAELKRYVLEAMRSTLVKNVDPTKFIPFLRSKFVLDARESAEIKSCCSNKSIFEGAEKLIDVLCTKGANGYDAFCQALFHDRTQVFLLTALNQKLELVRFARKQQVARNQAAMAHLQEQQKLAVIHQQELAKLQQYSVLTPHVPPSAHNTTLPPVQSSRSHHNIDPLKGMNDRCPNPRFTGCDGIPFSYNDVYCNNPQLFNVQTQEITTNNEVHHPTSYYTVASPDDIPSGQPQN